MGANKNRLSHLDESGNARMVDVGDKLISKRAATAKCEVLMARNTFNLVQKGGIPKGDVINTCKIAGVMAAKKTHDLIPLCHPLPLSQIILDVFPLDSNKGLEIVATVKTEWKTGVEMEALSGVNSALLAIYDLSKIVEPNLKITNTRLLVKSGGKKGLWINPEGIPKKIKNVLNI